MNTRTFHSIINIWAKIPAFIPIFFALLVLCAPAFAQKLVHTAPAFTPNRGQWSPTALFGAQSAGMNIWATKNGFTLDIRVPQNTKNNAYTLLTDRTTAPFSLSDQTRSGHVLVLEFLNTSDESRAEGGEILRGTVNFLRKNASYSNLPRFGDIFLHNLYAGISARLYFENTFPRYDLILEPNAQPETIRFVCNGADSVSTDAEGNLIFFTSIGEIRQSKPIAFQQQNGVNFPVECAFVLENHTIGFRLGNYNTALPLVIDPLVFSTFLGGAGDDAINDIAVDSLGFVYAGGWTESTDFPKTVGAYKEISGGAKDIFVTKLTGDGKNVIFSTYIGGTGDDIGYALTIASLGEIVVVGETSSPDFPVVNPLFSTKRGTRDGFALKLRAGGDQLAFSTYIGGSGDERVRAVALDSTGKIGLTGETSSSNYPTTATAFAPTNAGAQDAFITKISANGTSLLYSSYLGGSSSDVGFGIAADARGAFYVAGKTLSSNFPHSVGAFDSTFGGINDAFIVKLTANGRLEYSTLLGGNDIDEARSIACIGNGKTLIGGITGSADFPVSPNAFDTQLTGTEGFAAILDSLGASLSGATFVGGSGTDEIHDIMFTAAGEILCVGLTTSFNFPVSSDAFSPTYNTNVDAFLTLFSADFSALLYSTYFGGSSSDDATSVAALGNNAYIGGATLSSNFPTTPGAFQSTAAPSGKNAFVSRFQLAAYLRSPAGGEQWCAGTSQNIEWESTARVGNIGIKLVGTKDTTELVILNSALKSWTWDIPRTRSGGKYRLLIIDAVTGEVLSVSDSTFTIFGVPTLTVQPQSIAVCPDSAGQFFALASGLPTPDVQWQQSSDNGKTWNPLAGEIQPVLTVRTVRSDQDKWIYRARFSNLCDTAYSDSARLTVPKLPVIISQPESVSACTGATILFTVSTGSTKASIQWQTTTNGTWSNIIGENKDTLTVSNIEKNWDKTRFRAVVSDGCSAVSAVAQLTIISPAKIQTQPRSIVVCAGKNAVFSASASGNPVFVQWQKSVNASDWQNIEFSAQPTLILPEVQMSEEGWYRAVFFTPCGDSVYSQQARLTISPSAEPLLDRASLNFGSLDKCQTSKDEVVILSNASTSQTLTLTATNFSGSEFSLISPTLPLTIAPGQNAPITFRFVPISANASGLVSLIFEPCSVEKTIRLEGEKKGSSLISRFSSLSFGAMPSCLPQKDSLLEIRNISTDTIEIQKPFVPVPFVVEQSNFPRTLLPGQSVFLTASFAPSSDGSHTADALLPYSTSNCQDTLRVRFSGLRGTPKFIPSLSSIEFPALLECESGRDTTLTLKNTGTIFLKISKVSEASGFRLMNPLPILLAPNDSVLITLRFEPQNTGLATHTFKCIADECASEVGIFLSGTKQGVTFAIDKSAISFDDLLDCKGADSSTKALSITYRSESNVPARILKAEASEFFAVENISGKDLPKDSPVSFNVHFIPKNSGNYDGTLTLTFEPCNTVKVIPLSGKKLSPHIAPAADFVDYQKVESGKQKGQVITFVNSGNAVVTIDTILGVHPPFQIVTTLPAFPAKLAPNEKLRAFIVFTAQEGIFTANLEAISGVPCALRSDTTQLLAEGIKPARATIAVPSVEYSVGEIFDIPLTLRAPQSLQDVGIASFRTEISFNSTLLAPLDATIPSSVRDGKRTIIIEKKGIFWSDSILARIRVRAALGDAPDSPIEISKWTWLDKNDVPTDAQTERLNGYFRLRDVWLDGQPQLVNSRKFSLGMTIAPNPTSNTFGLTLSGLGTDAVLRFYDELGIMRASVADFSSKLQRENSGFYGGTITLHAKDLGLPVGIYLCRLTSGEASLVRLLAVE